MDSKINYGLIYDGKKNPDDYILGADNKAKYDRTVLMPDGRWRDFRSTVEVQRYAHFDDYGCITHSDLTDLACVMKRKIDLGLISKKNIQWLEDNGYFDENGNINFNDRFTAVMSKTRCGKGNSQVNVHDSIRNDGLTPQSKWNYTNDEFKTCELFYYGEPVPQEMKDLGKEFLKRFQINHEHLNANIKEQANEALKYSPISVLVWAWKKKNGLYYFPVPPEVLYSNYNHQVVKFDPEEEDGTDWIWDTYNDWDDTPFEKHLDKDYILGSAFCWFITDLSLTDEDMTNENVIVLKDKESSSTGILLLAKDAQMLERLCELTGKEVPRLPDGDYNWNEWIGGTFERDSKS